MKGHVAAPVVRMRGIVKRFGAVTANADVDLDLHPGEVHALLGENGAGKSTLMHILSGLLQPDEGSIELNGEPVHFTSARHALGAGIGMVHQHFKLVPTLSVAANVLLNDEPTRYGVLDEAAGTRRVAELADRLKLDVDPGAKVGSTSVSTQQKVEILKALHRDVRVLILDEPTAVLTPKEARDLFAFLSELAHAGTSIVVITHKLQEALSISERLNIMRAGKMVWSGGGEGQSPATLAKLMVGREVLLASNQAAPQRAGETVLALRGVSARDELGVERLNAIDLDLRAGEILGVAGVDGNGQHELVEVITGFRRPTAGELLWDGARIDESSVAEQLRRGVAFIPEDRHGQALVLDLPLRENLVLRTFRDAPLARRLRLNRGRIDRRARELLDEFDVRATPLSRARHLSGGNQQKVVLARELSGAPRLVVASQPTRGVDVAATQFVYRQLLAQRERGAAVLLVSLDLDELLRLSDRIAVLYRGGMVALLDRSEADEETIGLYMTGAKAA